MLSALLLLAFSARAVGIDIDRPSTREFFRLLQDVPAPPRPALSAAPRELVFEKDGSLIPADRLALELFRARVVYAGERHDQATHHQVQLKLLKALRASKSDLVVGLEMVSQDLQPNLDDYLSGRLSDADFEKFWKRAWGYSYDLYRPILEYCRAQRVRVIGLNAPIGVVRQVARGGLSSLTPDQRRWLPMTVAQTSDAKYLAYLERSLEGHGPMPPVQKARMLEAMAAWNETMGQKVADLASERPMLVLAGSGHMVYDKGVPESAARRGAASAAVVLPYPLDGEQRSLTDLLKDLRDPKSGEAELADHFWLLPKD